MPVILFVTDLLACSCMHYVFAWCLQGQKRALDPLGMEVRHGSEP